ARATRLKAAPAAPPEMCRRGNFALADAGDPPAVQAPGDSQAGFSKKQVARPAPRLAAIAAARPRSRHTGSAALVKARAALAERPTKSLQARARRVPWTTRPKRCGAWSPGKCAPPYQAAAGSFAAAGHARDRTACVPPRPQGARPPARVRPRATRRDRGRAV